MKVLVTGSSRGIGLAAAKKFLQEGHEVFGIDLEKSGLLHENYHHFVADIREKDALPDIKGLELLFLNAGVQDDEEAIKTNLEGTIVTCEKYGFGESVKSILFNASASARTGDEFPRYAASKAGVVAYMKHVAAKLASKQTTVNSISFGGVETLSNAEVMNDEELWQSIMEATPLKKWAKEEEAAEWVYFLLIRNQSMSGQDLLVDNGETNLRSTFVWPGLGK